MAGEPELEIQVQKRDISLGEQGSASYVGVNFFTKVQFC